MVIRRSWAGLEFQDGRNNTVVGISFPSHNPKEEENQDPLFPGSPTWQQNAAQVGSLLPWVKWDASDISEPRTTSKTNQLGAPPTMRGKGRVLSCWPQMSTLLRHTEAGGQSFQERPMCQGRRSLGSFLYPRSPQTRYS